MLKSFLGVFGPYTQFSCRVMRRFQANFIRERWPYLFFGYFCRHGLKLKKKVAPFFLFFFNSVDAKPPPPPPLPNYVHVKNILYIVRVGLFEGSVYAVLIYIEHCSSVSGSILQELYWHHHSSRFPEIPCPWKCGGF